MHDSVGSHGICPVCGWEDDLAQLRWPGLRGGANRPSLIEAQRHYREHRVSKPTFTPDPSLPRVRRDPGFRHFDRATDDFEEVGDRAADWPDDRTVLYWWRPTYWRRVIGPRRPNYSERLLRQVERYGASIGPKRLRSVMHLIEYGEAGLAANDFVVALAFERTPVAAADAETLRALLAAVALPPDTPPDVADRLVILDPHRT
ncbi:CPCC family cysteine-rich protein [Glycomyces paridis]|uniref:CPCC family cysteine-rich protein n=1 Tax=Glycomyces paridis TaxID=2126555 RepID=UPI00195CE9B6